MECVVFIGPLVHRCIKRCSEAHQSRNPSLLNLFLSTACLSFLCDTYQCAVGLGVLLKAIMNCYANSLPSVKSAMHACPWRRARAGY